MDFHTIGFMGLGLIGGSIAMKMKQNHPDVKIYATSHHIETIEKAYRMGLIENNTLLKPQDFKDCDVIFLCAPVERNIDYLKELKSVIKENCIITDVGSTKTKVHEEVRKLDLEDHFIGGHPMAGSEKTGLSSADASLLKGAYYIITPTAATTEENQKDFYDFVRSLGAIPLILDHKTHDYATAAISHLPHMIAYSLVNLVRDADDNQGTMKTIAAGGFKDLTRVASSSPEMWQNICLTNREPIVALMDRYIDILNQLKGMIRQSDETGLLSFFQNAKDYRDLLTDPEETKAV